MSKVKVPVIGTVNKVVQINPRATEGATFGVDLRWPDGEVITLRQLALLLDLSSRGQEESSSSGLVWGFIAERPANINQAAGLSGDGLIVRRPDGQWLVRSIAGQLGRITVADGTGEDGSPTVDLAEVTLDEDGVAQAFFVDAYGRVTATRNLEPEDIPLLPSSGVVRSPAPANSSFTLSLGDEAFVFVKSDDDPVTITIPEEASVDFIDGSEVEIINNSSLEDITIERASGVSLTWIGGDGSDNDRDIEPYGWARIRKIGEDAWVCIGQGVV